MKCYKWYGILSVGLGLLLTGCHHEVGDVFDQDATQRIEHMMADCRKQLQQADAGWRFDYKPANGPLAHFIMDFNPDGYVRMENPEGKTSRSTYKIVNAEGPVLSFDTYSILHELADPSLGTPGLGQGGEFEFIIQNVAADTLTLKGRKSGRLFKMGRAQTGEMQHIRIENLLNVDNGMDHTFFQVLQDISGQAVGLFEGPDSQSLNFLVGDEQMKTVGVTYTSDGFRLNTPVVISGKSVSELFWNRDKGCFMTADAQISLKGANHCPFNIGPTVERFLSHNYYTMAGASAAATLQLLELSRNIPEWQRMECFIQAQAEVDTLRYTVDVKDEVKEVGHHHVPAKLNYFSCVVKNEYGLPEWGNFAIKRVERKDADEVNFIEGIRNGAPASRLNSVLSFKKIKGIFFDTDGVTIAERQGNFYIVSASDARMWIALKKEALPKPAVTVPLLVKQ